MQTFEELGLSNIALKTLAKLGYETPTPIQERCIPAILSGSDIIGQAQTGTGKTAAFALPLLEKIDPNKLQPQVLVLTPTRELAIQVAEAFRSYASHLENFHILPIYGGQSIDNQLRQLKRGAQVIVGTPGRVIDHIKRKSLKLESLQSFVLDEADEMLNMGFIDDIEWILSNAPKQKQTALFSATMPTAIKNIAQKYLTNPTEIKIQSKTQTVETINQSYWLADNRQKLDVLTRILEVTDYDAAIIFVRTKTESTQLTEKLEARGHSCAALNGDLTQSNREQTIQRLKKGSIDIVVATDVAARGLDVERISHVINYDIPYDTESYVHRIGRTGRAGRAGNAILFVTPREKRLLRSIEQATKQEIKPLVLPSKDDITNRRVEKFKETVCTIIAKKDLNFYSDIVNKIAVDNESDMQKIAAALCYLAQEKEPLMIKDLPENKIEFTIEREYSNGRDGRRSRGGARGGGSRFNRRSGGRGRNYSSKNTYH